MDGRWWCAGRWTAISFGGKPATTTLPISLQRTTLGMSLYIGIFQSYLRRSTKKQR